MTPQAQQGCAGLLPALRGDHPEEEWLIMPQVDRGRKEQEEQEAHLAQQQLPIGRTDESRDTAHQDPCSGHTGHDEHEHTAESQGRKAPGGRRRDALSVSLVGPVCPRQQHGQPGEAAEPDPRGQEMDDRNASLHEPRHPFRCSRMASPTLGSQQTTRQHSAGQLQARPRCATTLVSVLRRSTPPSTTARSRRRSQTRP